MITDEVDNKFKPHGEEIVVMDTRTHKKFLLQKKFKASGINMDDRRSGENYKIYVDPDTVTRDLQKYV